MKSITLIAALSFLLMIILSLYYVLINFRIIHSDYESNKYLQVLYLLTNIGPFLFFIKLYQNQSKN
jgi:hypothetical protein